MSVKTKKKLREYKCAFCKIKTANLVKHIKSKKIFCQNCVIKGSVILLSDRLNEIEKDMEELNYVTADTFPEMRLGCQTTFLEAIKGLIKVCKDNERSSKLSSPDKTIEDMITREIFNKKNNLQI